MERCGLSIPQDVSFVVGLTIVAFLLDPESCPLIYARWRLAIIDQKLGLHREAIKKFRQVSGCGGIIKLVRRSTISDMRMHDHQLLAYPKVASSYLGVQANLLHSLFEIGAYTDVRELLAKQGTVSFVPLVCAVGTPVRGRRFASCKLAIHLTPPC